MKKNNLLLGALFFTVFHAHGAEITVAPNSNYFSNWSFSDFQPPAQSLYYYDNVGNRGANALPSGGGQNIGTLAGNSLTWTVPEQDATKITAGVFTTNRNIFGTNLPAGLFGSASTPAPGQGFLNRGTGQFSSPRAFAPGTTFFFQDFDNTETAQYRFYDCAGIQVDAGDFDFLKISTINTPSHSVQGTAPNRYWVASAVVASDPNTVSGITIKANNVCRIDISGTRPAGTGGSVNYFLGSPPNVVPTAVPAIAGTMQVGSIVTGTYAYADNESDIEDPAGTVYKFVTSSSASIASSSEGTTVASGATGGASASVPYTLQSTDLNMYIYYCVTPAAQTGASPGVEVCTAASGPIIDKPTPPASPANVPTLGEWSVAALSSLIAMFGFIRLRRRQN